MNHDGAADASEELAPGVRALDHTADVGLAVEAGDQASLFVRAARGLEALIAGASRGSDEEPPAQGNDAGVESNETTARDDDVALEASDVALLLADWLRELLYLRQVRQRAFAGARFAELDENRLRARVRTRPAGRAVREIKGVTYHGLRAVETRAGWEAQVIFDV